MKTRFIPIAAALAVGGLGLAGIGCDKDDSRTAGQKTGDAIKKSGEVAENAVDKTVDATKDLAKRADDAIQAGDKPGDPSEEIRDVLAQVSEAALTDDGVDDVAERLVDADRNRLGQGAQLNTEDYNKFVAQFNTEWKAKYGENFDVKDEDVAFPASTFMIRKGETPAGAAGAEVDVDVDGKADGSKELEVDVDRKSGIDSPDSTSADTNRNDPGRDIATLTVMASHGLQELTVPLIREAGGWKIDVPDTLTAEKLRTNLHQHLKTALDMKAQWPSNVNDAHAYVGHHVLMALLDMPGEATTSDQSR